MANRMSGTATVEAPVVKRRKTPSRFSIVILTADGSIKEVLREVRRLSVARAVIEIIASTPAYMSETFGIVKTVFVPIRKE